MTMDLSKSFATALALCLAASAGFAQDATTPAPATGEAPAATTGEAPATSEAPAAETPAPQSDPAQQPADGPGSSYIAKTLDDWSLQCFRSADGNDPCQMYQLLKDAKGNNVADISMVALPAGGKAVAGATIMTPLETLLTANLQLTIDNQQPKVYPFTFCAPPGCFARIGLTPEELAAFKKGNKVTMSIVPVASPEQPVQVTISLKGFTSAFEEVTKNNAKLQAPAK
ncbi:invasion associated locus B family protein [Paenirhodobacter sp.]|uniref:invasion associated locus B family protein n=1 Tax=Paenirhodobacter sp. TaxID=1965326 RepID=UPI003B3D879D